MATNNKVNSRVHVQIRFVFATIAFGMRIDQPKNKFVIHVALPKSIEG